ncbi:exodeoxyribonuclease V subunit gamma [Lentisphaerota bacterium WC36G]|nr:exodeoxyribonuclease V subunit gamma [Lentisphaerae bacterium WC36]
MTEAHFKQEFHLYSSSDLKLLARKLAEVINSDVKNNNATTLYKYKKIFQSEKVLVQSRGLEKFLNISLANENGATGNVFYPFPTSFINNEIFAKLFRNHNFYQYRNYFSPEKMAWRIFLELKDCLKLNEFATFKNYLAEGQVNLQLRYFQLATAIAEHFDRYLVFRPEVIVAWDNGENPLAYDKSSHWQKILWNRISEGATDYHFAALYFEFMQQVGDKVNHNFYNLYQPKSTGDDLFSALELNVEELKKLKRIFLFGFSSLPPAFLDIFNVLSYLIEVNFFYLNPCVEDWSYSQSLKDYYKQLSKTNALGRCKEIAELEMDFLQLDFAFENNLLGAWGKQGREFFHLLQNIEGVQHFSLDEAVYGDEFCDYHFKRETLLNKVQADIKTMQSTNKNSADARIKCTDDSIIVNSCHSPLRELEVLKNYLLHLFEHNEDIKVYDVLVMIPDIEKYSPYIEAVFKTDDFRDTQWMYSTIADCSNALNSPEVAVFFKILNLFESDFNVADISEIINSRVILEYYNIDSIELDTLNELIENSAINYGYESNVNSDIININSWQCGLNRMVSGYAMLSNSLFDADDFELECEKIQFSLAEKIYGTKNLQTTPYEYVEGNNSLLIGKLYDFIKTIANLDNQLKDVTTANENTLQSYFELAKKIIDKFFAHNADSAKLLHGAINNIQTQAEFSLLENNEYSVKTLKHRFDIASFKELLKNNFNLSINSGNFLHGGITFCKAQPMRSIPAKVVCLLGLSEKNFPRKNFDTDFNLMTVKRRFGDRNAKDDDRYFFLETVLSAQDKLYLSYVGQSIKDNSPLVASSVVEELLNYVDDHFVYEEEQAQKISENIRVIQPLNSYSKEYFTKNNRPFLYNYSRSDFEAMKVVFMTKSTSPFDITTGKSSEQLIKLQKLIAKKEHVKIINDEGVKNEIEKVKFSEIVDFFVNPSRYYMRNILNLDLRHFKNEELKNFENLTMQRNCTKQIFYDLISEFPASAKSFFNNKKMVGDVLYQNYFLKGMIAPGELGKFQFFQELNRYDDNFCNFVNEYSQEVSLEQSAKFYFEEFNLELEFDFDKFYLTEDNKVIDYLFLQPSKIYNSQEFGFKLWALAVNFCYSFKLLNFNKNIDHNGKIIQTKTFVFGNDKALDYTFAITNEQIFARIATLINIYNLREGYPLPFFVNSFVSNAELDNKRDFLTNTAAIWRVASEHNYNFGDGDDDFVCRCFGNEFEVQSPYADEFYLLKNIFNELFEQKFNNLDKLADAQSQFENFRASTVRGFHE